MTCIRFSKNEESMKKCITENGTEYFECIHQKVRSIYRLNFLSLWYYITYYSSFALEFDEPPGEESHPVRHLHLFLPDLHQLPPKFILYTIQPWALKSSKIRGWAMSVPCSSPSSSPPSLDSPSSWTYLRSISSGKVPSPPSLQPSNIACSTSQLIRNTMRQRYSSESGPSSAGSPTPSWCCWSENIYRFCAKMREQTSKVTTLESA